MNYELISYEGQALALFKGQSLCKIAQYGHGKWSKARIIVAIIEKEYFKNGKEKSTQFKMIQEVKEIQKGYTAHFTSFDSEKILYTIYECEK